ncbi:MAG TPA: PEGA domain-containing protein [Kofleriaceae bacterium]|nr:PEGA domain-containing protein [Kofleriaceae bacterium]
MVVLLLALGGTAWAGPKPTIAILGLEVADNGTGIDPETTKVAKDLTAGLRGRPAASGGSYVLAATGDKELIDEKLLNNCDSEAASCMAAIGTELQADLLMFGKIEKKTGQNGVAFYQVSLKLLNVSRKQVNSISENLPQADAATIRSSSYAKNWYAKLVGVTTGGTVQIKANSDRGTVIIDEETKGNLTSGALTVAGIPEGRHTLAIEANGYQRYEAAITVRTGETLSHTATLTEQSKASPPVATRPTTVEGTVSAQPKSNIWKPVFYTTAVVDAAAIGFTVYEWREGISNGEKVTTSGNLAGHIGMPGSAKVPDQGDCGKEAGFMTMNATDTNDLKNFKAACSNLHNQKIGWVVTGVMSVAVVGSFVMAYVLDRHSTETQSASGPHKKRREIAVTPIVSPDGGGATLRIDW